MAKVKRMGIYADAFEDLKDRIDDLGYDHLKKEVMDDVARELSDILLEKDIIVGDLSENPCRYKRTGIPATLVLEEDDTVRWYVNPDERSDLRLFEAPVTCSKRRK